MLIYARRDSAGYIYDFVNEPTTGYPDALDYDGSEMLEFRSRRNIYMHSVSAIALRIHLLSLGLLDDVEALIPSLSQEAQIVWKHSTAFEDNWIVTPQILAPLGFTHTRQFTDLFCELSGWGVDVNKPPLMPTAQTTLF